jgi:hypothetical protein
LQHFENETAVAMRASCHVQKLTHSTTFCTSRNTPVARIAQGFVTVAWKHHASPKKQQGMHAQKMEM